MEQERWRKGRRNGHERREGARVVLVPRLREGRLAVGEWHGSRESTTRCVRHREERRTEECPAFIAGSSLSPGSPNSYVRYMIAQFSVAVIYVSAITST